jgi:hypothetical protein
MHLGSVACRQTSDSKKISLNVTFEMLHKNWLLGLDCSILQLKGITFLRGEERRKAVTFCSKYNSVKSQIYHGFVAGEIIPTRVKFLFRYIDTDITEPDICSPTAV